jgi:hypothetical protein
MKDVAIMTVSQKIDESVKNRFSECIRMSSPKASYDIYFLDDISAINKPFNKSKILNRGIRTLSTKGYKVIIQSDIDLIVPPNIIDKSLEIGSQKKTCFYNHHRRVDPRDLPKLPEDYSKLDWDSLFNTYVYENANGCWNAMTPESWMSSGGFNEYMIEWGKEDDEFRSNAGNIFDINFINYNKFCLIHLNHPMRTKDMRKHNRSMSVKASKEGKTNWLI